MGDPTPLLPIHAKKKEEGRRTRVSPARWMSNLIGTRTSALKSSVPKDEDESTTPQRGHGPGWASPAKRRQLDMNKRTTRFASVASDKSEGVVCDLSSTAAFRQARSHSPGPGRHWNGENPVLNSCRTVRANSLFTPFQGAVAETCSFPHYPDCAHCGILLGKMTARWGTGLCDECYGKAKKTCNICCRRLHVKELKWGSGLCNPCFDACDKACVFCKNKLEYDQLHWRTGLCDNCYDKSDKSCRVCRTDLDSKMLRWGSGLCDFCYDSCDKSCGMCSTRLTPERWGTGICKACASCKNCKDLLGYNYGTGLCNTCYDKVEKVCITCQIRIPLGELHYRSALCNACYDKTEKNCKKCKTLLDAVKMIQNKWHSGICNECYDSVEKKCAVCLGHIAMNELHWDSGLCDKCWNESEKECWRCKEKLPIGQVRFGSSLCNGCYDQSEKRCKRCKESVPCQSLRWGTGLCDGCYDNSDKICHLCKERLQLGQLQWGTGLCDACYEICDKKCRKCECNLPFGQLHYATGYCNTCYDAMGKRKQGKIEGLSVGIWTSIVVQLVFYMAPALLTPSLFLDVKASDWAMQDAKGSYAVILAVASVVGMAAPVPLGLWADRRGEREVYVGVTVIAGIAGIALGCATNMMTFACAWGMLNAPPSIRGVRAVLFAMHVEPEDLSRAGQLASTFGLIGSVLGPIAATFAQRMFGDRYCFQVCAFLAMVAHFASAGALRKLLPAPEPKKEAGASTTEAQQQEAKYCEKCCRIILEEEEEARYRSMLCKVCFDEWGGEAGIHRFKRKVVISFCATAALLEVSMNAGVMATFQPIAVDRLGWGSPEIALVNGVSAGLSVVVSLAASHLRLQEGCQVAISAGLYVFGVLFFTMPPTRTWNVLIGLVCGLKAQILFMAPFTSIFSRLIGRTRVTNGLTIALCLAPGVGGAIGTVLSPFFLEHADTLWFMTAAIPAIVAWIFILLSLFLYSDILAKH